MPHLLFAPGACTRTRVRRLHPVIVFGARVPSPMLGPCPGLLPAPPFAPGARARCLHLAPSPCDFWAVLQVVLAWKDAGRRRFPRSTISVASRACSKPPRSPDSCQHQSPFSAKPSRSRGVLALGIERLRLRLISGRRCAQWKGVPCRGSPSLCFRSVKQSCLIMRSWRAFRGSVGASAGPPRFPSFPPLPARRLSFASSPYSESGGNTRLQSLSGMG